MDLQAVKEWIVAGKTDLVESAWLEALAEKAPADDMASVVESLAAAGRKETADELSALLLEERGDLPPEELLAVTKRLVTACPESAALRARLAGLYRQVHAGKSYAAGLVEASGLQGGQSPRRALRTLDLCLGLQPDTFLAGRFEGRLVQVKGFDESLGQFELLDEGGRRHTLEPKLLADEYEPIDPRDIRVLARYHPEDAKRLLADDPAGVLIGLCLARGGRISANDIKDFLVGHFLPAGEWSDWWSRARTAAKRSPNLTLEGRAPIVVEYHPGGKTLEEELAAPLKAARTPRDLHVLLQQYLREVKGRKLTVNVEFARGILKSLSEQAQSYFPRRPLDSLIAALAVELGIRAGLAKPAEPHPTPAQVLAAVKDPADLVAGLEDDALWGAGLEALAASPDAAACLRRLLPRVESQRLADVLAFLPAGVADEGVAQTVADALADPVAHLETFLWLWQGPEPAPSGVPGRVELLGRLLKAMGDLSRQWEQVPGRRKEQWQRIRAGLSAGDCAGFKAAAAQMDEHVAATVKRQVERLDGLAQAVRENLLQVLRERFPNLFFSREAVPPWLEEGTIWTSEAALHRREADYKELTEITIPANARAIGAAAAHGDISENSEWKFAMEERDMLGARKLKMEEELARARVLHPQDVSTDSVGIGSRVTLRRLRDGRELVMSFLGPWEGDPEKGVYSYQTKMAQDLMGRPLGDEVVLKLEGEEEPYRIERLGTALGHA